MRSTKCYIFIIVISTGCEETETRAYSLITWWNVHENKIEMLAQSDSQGRAEGTGEWEREREKKWMTKIQSFEWCLAWFNGGLFVCVRVAFVVSTTRNGAVVNRTRANDWEMGEKRKKR